MRWKVGRTRVAPGVVGGDGLGAVLTDFGVTVTGRCSTSCLAQFRRDAAVPADASQAGPRRRFGGAGVVALKSASLSGCTR